MNWQSQHPGLSEGDLDRVFRYDPEATTVVRMLQPDWKPVIQSLETEKECKSWLLRNRQSMSSGPGLVFILARRAGEESSLLQQYEQGIIGFRQEKANVEFENSLDEKDSSYSWPDDGIMALKEHCKPKVGTDTRSLRGGNREARHVPFTQDMFRKVCQEMFVYGSISRTISRADVPVFSRSFVKLGIMERKEMGAFGSTHAIGIVQAFFFSHEEWLLSKAANFYGVYNCRSANTWKNDLALTVTHFPSNGFTFAILFGCTAEIEREVMNRIAGSREQAEHPLLMLGIFAEIERQRMLDVVEATIDDIEGAIRELDTGAATHSAMNGSTGQARYARRSVWLQTTFLRNRLDIWRKQLIKMAEHADELSGPGPGPFGDTGLEDRSEQFLRTNSAIKERLKDLIEECELYTEDCTMRMDGMSIATQWSNGDINVDIASAAGRDSSQMRSISLVTMVFLPGTFFATVFSMTFFDWSGTGSSIVSGYLWIYILITGVFTCLTLFAWWYFLTYRPRQQQRRSTDEDFAPSRNA